MSDIHSLRAEINDINGKILSLISRRGEIVKKIGLEKKKLGVDIFDPFREAEQTSEILSNNKGPFSNESIERIFRSIYSESRKLQQDCNFLAIRSQPGKTRAIDCGKGVVIGGDRQEFIVGPCSVENAEQIGAIAKKLSSLGIKILRGGAFKPRTSPYDFQGLGEEGLEYLKKAADEYGMISISEATSQKNLEKVAEFCDIIQIGARNMYNYPLLEDVGKLKKPVLLKRHFSATIREFLYSAEYILKGGNENIILCERGIRTFENSVRNTLDISCVSILKIETYFPIVVDISHSAGRKDIALPLAKAALAAGADGVMVEAHMSPMEALSDRFQQLTMKEFEDLFSEFLLK